MKSEREASRAGIRAWPHRRVCRASWPAFAAALVALAAPPRAARAGGWVYACGFDSDNVVRFDLATGDAEVVVSVAEDASPRGVALDARGRVYIGLRGDPFNVKRFDPGTGALTNFTSSIGGYGTGHIAFDGNGDLIVAGDISANLIRYDGDSGAMIDSATLSGVDNVVGMALGGGCAYAADYHDDHILRYDLSAAPMAGSVFIPGSEVPSNPLGMTLGHSGNLFVSSSSQWIKEYDPTTGAFVADFADRSAVGATSEGLIYVPAIERYFLSAGDGVVAVDTDGEFVAAYQSAALARAYGLAYLPEPLGLSLLALGGLVLMRRRRGRRGRWADGHRPRRVPWPPPARRGSLSP